MQQLIKTLSAKLHRKHYKKIFTQEELDVEVASRLFEAGEAMFKRIMSGDTIDNPRGFMTRVVENSLFEDTKRIRKEAFSRVTDSGCSGQDSGVWDSDAQESNPFLEHMAYSHGKLGTAPSPYDLLSQKEHWGRVRKVLGRVLFDYSKTDPRYPHLIRGLLRGVKQQELAAELDLPAATVCVCIARIRKHALERMCHIDGRILNEIK